MKRDLDNGRNDRIEDFLDRITQGTQRMHSNVDDLLELSRIGRVIREKQLVDVVSIATNLAQEMAMRFESSQVRITVDQSIPKIYCDQARLFQVLENLISNALKYAKEDDKPLEINISGKPIKNHIHLSVSDNGPGVPQEYREKIFGLFQRLHTTEDGTGVGLAIVHRIARVHGGDAWVEPTPGGGATFTVSFPIHK